MSKVQQLIERLNSGGDGEEKRGQTVMLSASVARQLQSLADTLGYSKTRLASELLAAAIADAADRLQPPSKLAQVTPANGQSSSPPTPQDARKVWDDELERAIAEHWQIGQVFTLKEIYEFEERFSRLFPKNRHLPEGFRWALQRLRDQGVIDFVDNRGTYRRIR